MKTSAPLLTLFLLLAGCGSPEPASFVWTPDDVQATVFESNGMYSAFRKYTFDLSARKLNGHWRNSLEGERNAELLLSEDQAAQLVELLGRVRRESSKQRGCTPDFPGMSLTLESASGEARHYSTAPEDTSCGVPEEYAEEEDVRAVIDACAALIPTTRP